MDVAMNKFSTDFIPVISLCHLYSISKIIILFLTIIENYINRKQQITNVK